MGWVGSGIKEKPPGRKAQGWMGVGVGVE